MDAAKQVAILTAICAASLILLTWTFWPANVPAPAVAESEPSPVSRSELAVALLTPRANDIASVAQQKDQRTVPAQTDVPRLDPYLRAGPYDPTRETESQWKHRAFRRLLAQVDGESIEAPDWPGFDRQQLAPVLLSQSLSAHLEASDRIPVSGDANEARREAKAAGFDKDFSVKDRTYFFRTGDYPAWDSYLELIKLDPVAQLPFGVEPEPPRQFNYPEEFFQSASAFAHEALQFMP